MNVPTTVINPRTVAADYTVTPAALGSILKAMISIKRPVMVWGQPGVGKSMCAQEVAKTIGASFIDVRALLMDTVDFRGIPHLTDDGQTRWAPPDFLPKPTSKGTHLICLEELPAAMPTVQAALYQLMLDRAIGEYKLPPGAALMAAGNRESDRAVSHRMPTALANRMIHIDVRVDIETWKAWAAKAGIAHEVLFFLHFRPELLSQFDPKQKNECPAFATPRTWEMVSDIMKANHGLDDDALRAVLRGTVGEGPAVEFYAFLQMYRKLPLPSDVLAHPDTAPTFDDDPQCLLAMCGAVYRLADDTNFDAVVEYAQRIRPEVGEFLVSSSIARDPSLAQTAARVKWITTNQT